MIEPFFYWNDNIQGFNALLHGIEFKIQSKMNNSLTINKANSLKLFAAQIKRLKYVLKKKCFKYAVSFTVKKIIKRRF